MPNGYIIFLCFNLSYENEVPSNFRQTLKESNFLFDSVCVPILSLFGCKRLLQLSDSIGELKHLCFLNRALSYSALFEANFTI